jgi:hypothetical protein
VIQQGENKMKTSKAFKRWKARIEDTKTPWTEKEIVYFRAAIGKSGLARDEERHTLKDLFKEMIDNTGGVRITQVQDIKGQQYLLNNSLKLNGEPRKNNILGSMELNILKTLDYHLFVGVYNPVGFQGFDSYLPIYRAISTSGAFFEYTGTVYDQITIIKTTPNLKLVG